jgi:hypothetical protein
MGVAAMLVVVLTALAQRLGPQLSGILTAFPVATVVIGVFTQVQRGHEALAAFFRGLIRGLHSFVLFCVQHSTGFPGVAAASKRSLGVARAIDVAGSPSVHRPYFGVR